MSHEHASSEPTDDLIQTIQDMLGACEDGLSDLDRRRDMVFLNLEEELRRYQAVIHGALQALAEAVDAKDAYTHGHSRRVSLYSTRLGNDLGLGPRELDNLAFGALLHDVGKIGMPESILNKPAALTPEEFEIVKEHPVRGSEILSNIPDLREVERVVRHHHERIDGAGYPDRLSGFGIPLHARVVAVVDTFDAITTTRSYHRAKSPEHAFRIMVEAADGQLDAELVLRFERLWRVQSMAHIIDESWHDAGAADPDSDRQPTQASCGALGCDHGLLELVD